MKYLLYLFLFVTPVVTLAQKTKRLFNGKDLTGWTIHGTEKWYVDKGELVCESGPDKQYGYLSTNSKYKNFELTLNSSRRPMAIAAYFSVHLLKG
nr:family 16 glycoside hydrolase [Paraflavitalea speifideiaquila]